MLDKINSPKDLRAMPLKDLPELAQEIRRRIIEVVSRQGGHLASSLGAVELAIALHYCLNTPDDIIIWDVGHQSYPHKILTGRNKRFDTLRQKGGLSGFPCGSESEFDAFTTGHASTAISLALGIVCGRDIKGDSAPAKAVAVIGDGSLSGGPCFEGLNNAGHLGKDIIVVLNTNELSIAPNVGALSVYLNKIISLPLYNRFRDSLEGFLKNRVKGGKRLLKLADKLEEGIKGIFIPGAFFEEMGFRYFGPFDGHDLNTLIPAFKNILNLKGPIIFHVITKKGKGFKPAEDKPVNFHSAPPFDMATGEPVKKAASPAYTEIFSGKLLDIAGRNNRVVAITAAMPEGTGLDRFRDKYPERFFDVGIAEEHAVCFAAGLAKKGLIPVVAVYSTFLQRAFDQLIMDAALQDLSIVFALDRAGVVGGDGVTHQGIFDIAYLSNVPGMVVMAPKDAAELEKMLEFAVDFGHPVAIRYPKSAAPGTRYPSGGEDIKLGMPEVIKQGRDIVIIALGSMAAASYEAALELEKSGVSVKVINARFAKPINAEFYARQIKGAAKVFTIEEGITEGGFGARLAQTMEGQSECAVRNIGLPCEFIAHAGREELLVDFKLDKAGITEQIRRRL